MNLAAKWETDSHGKILEAGGSGRKEMRLKQGRGRGDREKEAH